jgi:hypothetical protein
VGLPVVDPSWRGSLLDAETLVWQSPMGTPRGRSSYYDKLVSYSRGKIVEEVDFYSNGQRYDVETPAGGKEPRVVNLVIHFNYERAARGKDPWSCALTRGPTDEEMSLEQAEDVLASWGLKRLNY